MQIYLMRHGDYLSAEKDPERGLSETGAAGINTAARALARLGASWDAIVTSHKTRARQTAELVALAARFPPDQIQTSDHLTPDSPPDGVIEILTELEVERVLLVGHLPNLARVAAMLLAGEAPAALAFPPGAICRLDAQAASPGAGQLIWHLTPDILSLMTG